MSHQDTSPEMIAIALAGLVIGGGSLFLAGAMGADFMPILTAVVWTVVVTVGGALWLWFRVSFEPPNWLAQISAMAVFIWPSWWKAIDSIAANAGMPKRSLFAPHSGGLPWLQPVEATPWWATAWAYGLSEALLVAILLFSLTRALKGGRY